MRFGSFFSIGFISVIVVNPPERKLAKRTSVTPPIAEILCVKNGRAIVVLWVPNEIILKKYAESLKKIVGAL